MTPRHHVRLALDPDRYRKVTTEAERQGVSVAQVIRQAIDALPDRAERRRQAIDAILAAKPMPVPDDPRDLRRETDRTRSNET